MTISIYTSSETNQLLEKLRKEDNNFNLSEWFAEQLRKYNNADEEEDVVKLSEMLEDAKIMQMKAEAKQENIRQRLARVKLRQEEDRKRESAKLSREEQDRQYKLNSFLGMVEAFPELKGFSKKELKELAEEFIDLDVSMPEFLREKGILQERATVEKVDTGKTVTRHRTATEEMDEFINSMKEEK